MSAAQKSMGLGLRALGRIAGSDLLDRFGLRSRSERALYRATRDGFRAATAASRTFSRATASGKGTRLPSSKPGGLFDLTPTDEQKMLVEAIGDFAAARLRTAALKADSDCQAQPEVLTEAAELGLSMLGVSEEHGGAVAERSSVTTVLAAEALAHGDLGLAVAALAGPAVATTISTWGDAAQQGTYLPDLVGDDPPVAALALAEPVPLFDPLHPGLTARRDGGDYVLNGVKALVPRAVDAQLMVVGASVEGGGPALFVIETTDSDGLLTRATPAMGVRAAALGELRFDDVRVPSRALLGEGSPEAYRECVWRSRLAWCALACGTARAVLDYVIPYVNERVAFGEPISHRQAVAFTISNIAIEVEGMRLLTLRAASRADAGSDYFREAALARSLCTTKGAQIGSDGVQLLGGHGYIKEHPVERWYRDLEAIGVVEGGVLA